MIDAESRPALTDETASVHELLQFERLMSELSASFINLPASEVDTVIENGLRRIVETLDVDRSSLTQLDAETGQLRTTHSWAVAGMPRVRAGVWPTGGFHRLLDLGRAGKPLVFSTLDDLPPEAAADRLSYHSIGIRSHVAQPIIVAGELIGFLGFACLRRERAWAEELVARMRALADVFASALARRHVQEDLDQALGFERLATRTLAALLLHGPDDVERVIDTALRDIAQFLGVERVTLWERTPGRSESCKVHLWLAAGVPVPAERIGVIEIPWISARLAAGEVVKLARMDALPAGADRRALEALGVRSLLAVPLSASGEVVGALSVAAVRAEREWTDALIPGLRLLAEVFASLHLRRSVERQQRAAEAEAAQWRDRFAHVVRVHTVGEMSAAIAHEITQPLGAIENYARAALRRASDPVADQAKIIELLEKTIRQATRASDVVARLRGLVKRKDIDPVRIDIERTVRACTDMVKMECELRDIRIDVRPARGLPDVVADEIHIQQVIINLLRNAMDSLEHAPPAARTITIETAASGPDVVSVRVSDHGPGIPEGDLERVFESFYSTKPGGLGIGLAICRTLVEAHGGTLRASANPGGGAVFQFTLPVAAASGPAA